MVFPKGEFKQQYYYHSDTLGNDLALWKMISHHEKFELNYNERQILASEEHRLEGGKV